MAAPPEVAALFDNADAARRAIVELQALKRGGADIRRIELRSPIPYPDLEDLLGTAPVILRRFTLGGALFGACLGFLLAAAFAQSMFTVQVQGGKPVIPLPANFVIMYELTILFGVWFTLIGFLVGAGLPAKPGRLHTHKVGEDQLGLWVQAAAHEPVRAVFRAHGAVQVLEEAPA